MMLPERRELLLKERDKQGGIPPPTLDDHQLEKMNDVIVQSIEQERAVTIQHIDF
ncbi:YolD-like family protein [Neobacillus sp. NPDC097160]|uniref:YolD-like family protein n=1 Tax=Neobacillus sp. NPDC097160 TaxID=3364298 RepID=UPI00382F75B6